MAIRRPAGSPPRENLVGLRLTDNGLALLDAMRRKDESRQDLLRRLLSEEAKRQHKKGKA